MIELARRPRVETAWLADHMRDPALRIVDARWRGDGPGTALYQAAHLPCPAAASTEAPDPPVRVQNLPNLD